MNCCQDTCKLYPVNKCTVGVLKKKNSADYLGFTGTLGQSELYCIPAAAHLDRISLMYILHISAYVSLFKISPEV